MSTSRAQPRADAHIHLFDPGFAQGRPPECRQTLPTELTLYDELARRHTIEAALVVAYEGKDWANGNNAYLASLIPDYPWLCPVAYVHDPRTLTTDTLAEFADQGFVGISLYLFPETDAESGEAAADDPRLTGVSADVWHWLTEHRWLISVNSSGAGWHSWARILGQHPKLRLLVAHLGLPPSLPADASPEIVAGNLAPVMALAGFPHTIIKISGLYALSEPGYAFPHASAWPYVQTLLAEFGPERLVWGSDFAPALDSVSFVQTVHVLDAMPFLTPAQRTAIQYKNLIRLLDAVRPARHRTSGENSP